MKPASAAVAALFAIGGAVPALLLMALLAVIHVARSPERMLDAAYVCAFCGLGYLAG